MFTEEKWDSVHGQQGSIEMYKQCHKLDYISLSERDQLQQNAGEDRVQLGRLPGESCCYQLIINRIKYAKKVTVKKFYKALKLFSYFAGIEL